MWIFFQVKRFFSIWWRESFLFFNNSYNKVSSFLKGFVNRPKEVVPVFHKELIIKLDKKKYDFYTLQPRLEKPFYSKSALFSVIQKNKKDIFENLIFIFEKSYDFKLKIGIEIEFYILKNDKKLNIVKELKKRLPFVSAVEREKGEEQYEIKTFPYTDMYMLADDYLKILDVVEKFSKENNLDFVLSALPFDGDCGSALQINLSIVDSDGKNLFARVEKEKELVESDFMLKSIAGILKNINNNLLLYIKDKNCLARFDVEKNKLIRKNNKYPAPTFVSWGVNNRTASIRIPTPSKIDLESYMKDDRENRRIEFRLPSANADIYLTLIGVISSVIEGFEDDLMPLIDKTSFDVLEKNDGFEKIESDFENANDIFKINKDILFY